METGDFSPELVVLVVEDQADLRRLMARLIAKYGVTVHAAASADEARSLMATIEFSGIFCDIGMPGEDGMTFVASLRASSDPSRARLPVAALTGYASVDVVKELTEAGFDLHLQKPVDLNQLRDALVYFRSSKVSPSE